MKQQPTLKQIFRYRIAACPKCGSRKIVSWTPCDICGTAVFDGTQTTPVVEENHGLASSIAKFRG